MNCAELRFTVGALNVVMLKSLLIFIELRYVPVSDGCTTVLA